MFKKLVYKISRVQTTTSHSKGKTNIYGSPVPVSSSTVAAEQLVMYILPLELSESGLIKLTLAFTCTTQHPWAKAQQENNIHSINNIIKQIFQ